MACAAPSVQIPAGRGRRQRGSGGEHAGAGTGHREAAPSAAAVAHLHMPPAPAVPPARRCRRPHVLSRVLHLNRHPPGGLRGAGGWRGKRRCSPLGWGGPGGGLWAAWTVGPTARASGEGNAGAQGAVQGRWQQNGAEIWSLLTFGQLPAQPRHGVQRLAQWGAALGGPRRVWWVGRGGWGRRALRGSGEGAGPAPGVWQEQEGAAVRRGACCAHVASMCRPSLPARPVAPIRPSTP